MIRIWFVAVEGEPAGPMSVPEVRELHRQGKVDGASYVWREGMEKWMPIETVGELAWITAGDAADAHLTPQPQPGEEHAAPALAVIKQKDTPQPEQALVRVDYNKIPEINLTDGYRHSRDIIRLKKPGVNRTPLIIGAVVVSLVILSFLLKALIDFGGAGVETTGPAPAGRELMDCVRECVAENGDSSAQGYEKCRRECSARLAPGSDRTQPKPLKEAADKAPAGETGAPGFPPAYTGGRIEWDGSVITLRSGTADAETKQIDCESEVIDAEWEDGCLVVELGPPPDEEENITVCYTDFNTFHEINSGE